VPQESTIDPFYKTPEWRELRLAVFIRDGKICRYCGQKGTQADHVIPRRRGGPDHLDNLVCACHRCNELVLNRRFRAFIQKRINEVEQVVVATPEGRVTICNGPLPDHGSYQHWGMSTRKGRAKRGRRASIRKRRNS
jgi:hypothetical protein